MKESEKVVDKQLGISGDAACTVGERGREREEEEEEMGRRSGHVCFDPLHCARDNMRRRLLPRSRHRVGKDFLGLSEPNNPASR